MFRQKPKFNISTLGPGETPAPEHPPAVAPQGVPLPTASILGGYKIRPVPPPRRRIAFLVFHGMGQQVPYETQSMLAECMVGQESRSNTTTNLPDAKMVRVKITDNPDDPPLARIEFTVERPADGQSVESIDVHVYEAYWAPLTEGKISFLETISFLFSAAMNGIKTCLRGGAFERWMFGDFQNLPIKGGALLALLSAMAGLVVFLSPVALFYSKWKAMSGAASLRELFVGHWVLSFLSLMALALYTWAIRYFLVEYVGDVAIYVSSYTVSRFEEVRTQIQNTVFSVLRQIYSSRVAGGDSENTYSKVILIGHSLGSVIAYDALNAAISWDAVEKGGRMEVVRRTPRLITFGSPLDKTAFLFRTQVSGPRFMREALAAQKQPLILDYRRWRPQDSFRWVNIYSRADVISGKLSYYDLPHDPSNSPPPGYNPVINKPDYQAWIPFAAHIQYWNNSALHEELFAAIGS
jgi:hypothetical protein